MDSERDVTQIVRSWLRTDEHESADRVLDDVLQLLDANTQHRSWWSAWRPADLRAGARLTVAAASVVVAVAAGLSLLPSFGVVGGPTASSPASPSPSLSSVPTTRPSLGTPESDAIPPGSFVISTPQTWVHLTVPSGWSSGDSTGVYRFPDIGWIGMLSLSLTPYEISYVVADVCAAEEDVELLAIGPTVEDLTTALANQAGVERTDPVDIMLGGYPAKQLVVALPPECPGAGGRWFWADAMGTYGFGLDHRATGTIFVVDVNGDRVVITSQREARASVADVAQLEAITASIEIEPVPGADPAPDVAREGPLPIGRHPVIVDGVSFTYSVPAFEADKPYGWARYGSLYISKDTAGSQGAEAVIYWTGFPDGANTDPCVDLLSPAIGPSTNDLAMAMAAAPGTELVSGPSDVTVGGRAAMHVVLTVRVAGCDPGFFFTWEPAGGGPGWWSTNAGDTVRAWIVGGDGRRLVIVGATTNNASSRLEQEVMAIVDSIEFE